MNAATTLHGEEKYRAFLEGRPDPPWLLETRKNGLALYEELSVAPSPSRDRNFPTISPQEIAEFQSFIENPKLVCEDKRVVLESLSTAVLSCEEKIRPILGGIFKANQNKWVALNQAVWQSGAFVHVPNNVDAAAPVLIQHLLPESSRTYFPRIVVVTETGSRVILIDHYQAQGAQPSFVSPVIEILAGENSEVHYVQIQELGEQTHHFAAGKILTRRNARVNSTSCMFGGRRTVSRMHASLQGEGSQANLFGLVFGDHEQVFEHYTLQEHLASHTQSDLLIKVALKGKAYSHFDGLIWIEKGAGKSSAYQQNRNLLLSHEAKADSTPRLEILENDILGCTHGAAVGPVDQEQLFYLESRGIPMKEAEALVVEGFFEQVLARITVESLRERLRGELSQRLRM